MNNKDRDISIHIKLLITMRIIVMTVLMGILLFLHINKLSKEPPSKSLFIYYVFAITYGISIVYFFLLKAIKEYRKKRLFIRWQLVIDQIFIATLVVWTGGIESLFSFLFFLPVIVAGLLIGRQNAFYLAVSGIILFSIIVLIQSLSYGIWNESIQGYRYKVSIVAYIANVVSLLIVAFLSGYLSEQLSRSEHKLAEKELDLSRHKEFHKLIVNSMESGLIIIQSDYSIKEINRYGEKILKIKKADIKDRDIRKVFPEIGYYLEGIEQGKIKPNHRAEITIKVEGEDHIIGFSISKLRDLDKKTKGKVILFQDLTETRRLEERMKRIERMAYLGEMASHLIHEIRNPLASISGSAEMLVKNGDEVSVRDSLSIIIQREVQRLNKMVDEFQNFSSPRQPEPVVLNLNTIINEIVDSFTKDIRFKNKVNVEKKIPYNLTLFHDKDHFIQILWNILVNCAEAMEDKGGIIKIKAEKLHFKNLGYVVRLIIQDEGPGIDPQIKERIFDPFFTTKVQGSGIGLSIVQQLLEINGGEINLIESNEGGACFELIWYNKK